jgi:hypothetical protein
MSELGYGPKFSFFYLGSPLITAKPSRNPPWIPKITVCLASGLLLLHLDFYSPALALTSYQLHYLHSNKRWIFSVSFCSVPCGADELPFTCRVDMRRNETRLTQRAVFTSTKGDQNSQSALAEVVSRLTSFVTEQYCHQYSSVNGTPCGNGIYSILISIFSTNFHSFVLDTNIRLYSVIRVFSLNFPFRLVTYEI